MRWAAADGGGWKAIAQRLGVDWQVAQAAAGRAEVPDALETQWERKGRLWWERKLDDVGWSGFGDALAWAASTHHGYRGIGSRIGISDMQAGQRVRWWIQANPDWFVRVAPSLVSTRHHLAVDDDGLRQCHVCALWFGSLVGHIRVHGISTKDYRTEFGLPEISLASDVPRGSERMYDPDYWESVLRPHGFDSLATVAIWAAREELTQRELAERLGVPEHYLGLAFRAGKISLPTKRARMLDAARREVAAGGNLSAPSDRELKAWMVSQRTTVRMGKVVTFTDVLDDLDPDWRLSAGERNG